jgi:hypothetical protein
MYKSIGYYISDYGYGHAARSIALLRHLLANDDSLRVYIITDEPLSFIRESLKHYNDRLIYRRIKNDLGLILKSGSLNPDYKQLNRRIKPFINSWEDYIQKEVDFYTRNPLDLIISDITPQAFIVAKKLGIESIGISNFTWYDIYKDVLDKEIVSRYKNAYEQCDYFFSLGFEIEELQFRNKKKFGIFSRDINEEEVDRIRNGIPDDGYLVYLALGKSVDLQFLNKIKLLNDDKITFLVSQGADLKIKNIIKIPQSYTETQNYTAACDLVVTKAGWSTISECIIGKVPFIVIKRDQVKEDRNTVEILLNKYKGICKVIEQEDLNNINFNKIMSNDIKKMKQAYKKHYFNSRFEIVKIIKNIFRLLKTR